jgi:hypothetical protein
MLEKSSSALCRIQRGMPFNLFHEKIWDMTALRTFRTLHRKWMASFRVASYPYLLTFLLTALSLCLVEECWATLGAQVETIEIDRQSVQGNRHLVYHTQFTTHEISYSGQILREYVANSGVVFAVTWKGITHPDLSLLLGNYYDEISSALDAPVKHGGARTHRLQSTNVVIEKGGHMRAVQGRAYIPALIPEGVHLEDIL